MAKYVNLSRAGSGYAGTDPDPFSYPDFKLDVDIAGAETYNLQGEKETIADFFNSHANQIYQAWDASLYGPFRLRDLDADNFTFKGIWRNGIIEIGNNLTGGALETLSMYTCFLKCYAGKEVAPGQLGLLYGDTVTIRGCTLIISKLSQVNMGVLDCLDTILDVTTWLKGSPPP